MEMHKDNSIEKRRRKVISREPVLVRSAKPGQASVGIYARDNNSSVDKFWKNSLS
jgi:hypothetical protein